MEQALQMGRGDKVNLAGSPELQSFRWNNSYITYGAIVSFPSKL